MDTERLVMRVVVFLAVTGTMSSGCAMNRADLAKSGVLTIEERAEGKVQIAWSSVHEGGDGFVVAGVLTRPDHVGLAIRAHVDVSILSPDQNVLYSSRTQDIYVPPHVTGRCQSLKRFNVRFPRVPPNGSSVRLVCHSDLDDMTQVNSSR